MSSFRRRLMWIVSNSLYRELDHIIVPQKAYIDTLVTPTTAYSFETKFEIINTNTWCLYANDSTMYATTIRMFQQSGQFNVTFGTYAKSNSTLSTNTVYTIKHSHTKYLTVNGDSSTYQTSVGTRINSATLKLFYSQYMLASANNYQWFNGNKFYYQKIYNGSTLVRDFIPCVLLKDTTQTSDGKTHSKGEIGLWDKVTNKFYGNAGSGTITY